MLFGLFPALQTSKPDLVSTLKEASGRSGTGVRHKRVRSALVVAEMALALVLLVGAALLIRSFVGLRSVDPGFDPRNVFTFQTSLASGAVRDDRERRRISPTQVIRRARDAAGSRSGGLDHRAAGRGGHRPAVHHRRQTADAGRVQRR